MADIFKDKTEMPAPNSTFTASANNLRSEFEPSLALPGEVRESDLDVKNLEPRKRGCHY